MRETQTHSLGMTLAECHWGDGQQIILALHGWQDNAASFAALGEALEASSSPYQLIAIDLPGHGKSGHFPPSQFYNLWDYLPVLAERIAQCAEPVWLLGHSLGGMLATQLAALLPQQVCGLITLDMVGLRADKNTQQVTQFLNVLREQLVKHPAIAPSKSFPAMVARRASVGSPFTTEANAALMARGTLKRDSSTGEEWHLRIDPRVRIGSLWRFQEEQSLHLAAQVACPWHVVVAESGFFAHPLVERLRNQLPIQTVTWWPGGHHCHMESSPHELWNTLVQRIEE
ncbi:alpha/beta fold hydrolase [Salinispirillum marinum]|uniref:Alpha/beta fold hydrolase n=2 Tax=Saccharospirillaceae TaxID=255527 RepID=A0ABV8BHT2_9GAMM